MAAEGEFPKVDGDILYASETNKFNNAMVFSSISQDGAAEATRYIPINGRITGGGNGAVHQSQSIIPRDGILTNLYAKANSNSHDQNYVVTVMINGVASALTVTITAGSTAVFSDTSNAPTVSAGDRVAYRVVLAAGTGAIDSVAFGMVLQVD